MTTVPGDLAFDTLADLLFFVTGRYPRERFIGRCREGGIDWQSTRAFFDRVRDVGLGLQALGLGPGDRIGLASESRPEWLVVDFAAQTIGAVIVPIYPTLTAAQSATVLADAGTRIAVASDRTQLEKLQDARRTAAGLDTLIVVDDAAGSQRDGILSLSEVAAHGHARILSGQGVGREYREQARRVGPEDLATLIYTSGTTGEPKGVMLTHANIVSNVKAGLQVLPVSHEDVALSFLPLSHAFERTVVYCYLAAGATVVFAERLETVPRDLSAVRPTVMAGVPRFFEKMHARMLETAARGSTVKRTLVGWAAGVAAAWTKDALGRGAPSLVLRLQHAMADRLVFARIRAALGGRLRCLISGSAALSPAIGEFFFGAGLPVMEGYGLTETAPILAVNPPDAPRFGTVGRALPGVELRIDEDGEILARGPNVMRGYYNRPGPTAEVLRDGWFHTGDVGHLDPDGYLAITDRKKDLLVTSGGKKIPPQPIESVLKLHPLVLEAVLVGERRKFPAVLLVPDFAALEGRLRESGRPIASHEELVHRADVVAMFQAIVDEVNLGLAQYERIKKLALLPQEFSIEGGELTPTLKVRRKVVEQRWHDVIEAMYVEDQRSHG